MMHISLIEKKITHEERKKVFNEKKYAISSVVYELKTNKMDQHKRHIYE